MIASRPARAEVSWVDSVMLALLSTIRCRDARRPGVPLASTRRAEVRTPGLKTAIDALRVGREIGTCFWLMDVPHGFDPTLILVLNLAGTFIFGLSGGLAAVRAKLD